MSSKLRITSDFSFSKFLENVEFILENDFEIHSREFSRNQFSSSITKKIIYYVHMSKKCFFSLVKYAVTHKWQITLTS